ncbi:hypothetical protein Hanom_Chr08g00692441 [Helianthus anomalus]
MWVSILKKRVTFRIRMGFGQAQVSAQDGLRHEIGFGSARFQFELSFGPRRVLARDEFWIRTGRFRSGSGRHGTGFRPTRVSARDGFRIATGFRPTGFQYFQFFFVSFRFFVSVWSVYSVSFRLSFSFGFIPAIIPKETRYDYK